MFLSNFLDSKITSEPVDKYGGKIGKTGFEFWNFIDSQSMLNFLRHLFHDDLQSFIHSRPHLLLVALNVWLHYLFQEIFVHVHTTVWLLGENRFIFWNQGQFLV